MELFDKMRFIVVGPTYPLRGGIAHFTTLLVKKLREQGHFTHLYTFRRGYPGLLYPGATNNDPSSESLFVEAIPTIHPLQPWTWIKTARNIIADHPDAVILEWWVLFWAPFLILLAVGLRRVGILVIIDCQNVLPHERSIINRFLTSITLRQGDICLVYSTAHELELLDLLPGMSHKLLPFPIFGPLARPTPSSHDLRVKLGLSDIPTLLFFGFVRPYKGLSVLIRALEKVNRSMAVHLLIVGEFWESSKSYRKLIKKLGLGGKVVIIDRYIPDEEISDYFGVADAVVIPYLQPVQSGVLALSQAYRKPVIASRIGGLLDSIEEEKTGLLFEARNEDDLAKAILRFYQDDFRNRMKPFLEKVDQDAAWMTLVQALTTIIDAKQTERIPKQTQSPVLKCK
jgi:glycosyltransferase involved in cell wall biosynthesis